MRRLLWPLNPVYAAAISLKNTAYDRGWLKAKRPQWPVVSVGNISVGGSGKTPFVIALAKLLTENGIPVDVLSRGYGRSSRAVERVDALGDAARFGDEPLLIAQSTAVPVYVGADRYHAGLLAEREGNALRIHLLDDGFQHRRLLREMDIVLLHRDDFFQSLLPAGNLREPFSALDRASVIVLREEDAGLGAELKRRGLEVPVWQIRRSVKTPENACRVVAFCGIARPEEFFSSLRENGIEIAAMLAFRDHHSYSEEDIKRLIGLAKSTGAGFFLTTEKDSARLPRHLREELNAFAALKVVRLEVKFLDERSVLQMLQDLRSYYQSAL